MSVGCDDAGLRMTSFVLFACLLNGCERWTVMVGFVGGGEWTIVVGFVRDPEGGRCRWGATMRVSG
jgi:hypothetical protein